MVRIAKKKADFKYDPKWAEAKTKCRLNANDVEMAKRLGFTPKALLKNIPGPKELWKQPVKFWIRDLYLEKFGSLLGEETPKQQSSGNPSSDQSFDWKNAEDDLPF